MVAPQLVAAWILWAISAFLIDRKFYTAAVWSLIAATFAAMGLTHAYQINGNVVDFLFIFANPHPGALPTHTFGIAVGYLLFAAVFGFFGWYAATRPEKTPILDHGTLAERE